MTSTGVPEDVLREITNIPDDVYAIGWSIAQDIPPRVKDDNREFCARLIARAIMSDRTARSATPAEVRVTDHKWFDPVCHFSGCQSLVLKHAADWLIEAGNKLSFAAQTTGGTAGRDDTLVAAIDRWTEAATAFAALSPTPGAE